MRRSRPRTTETRGRDARGRHGQQAFPQAEGARTRPERRLTPRQAVRLEAEITLPGGRALACLTVDVSTSGARLAMRGGILLPESFAVAIPRGAPARRARLVWRSDEMIGLQYV